MESILIFKNEIFKPKINEINDIKYIVYYVGISATKKKQGMGMGDSDFRQGAGESINETVTFQYRPSKR